MIIPDKYRYPSNDPVSDGIDWLHNKYGIYRLSKEDIIDAIRSACDFFEIPMPRAIFDLTHRPGGQTMFINRNSKDYYDDEICFNMDQLAELKVRTKDAFSLVMTHECAHRVFQNTVFQGRNNGAWESELCADFFMGVRAYLCGMNAGMVSVGLILSGGSTTHPEGAIRSMFVSNGKTAAWELTQAGYPLTIKNLFAKFNEYLVRDHADIELFQRKIFGY